MLGPTKEKVLDIAAALKASGIKDVEPILNRAAGPKFDHTSKLDFQKLKGEPLSWNRLERVPIDCETQQASVGPAVSLAQQQRPAFVGDMTSG